jgi:hypothetical protein
VLVSLARMAVEDHGMETYGGAVLPLLEAHRQLESNAWAMAHGILKPSQVRELKDLIEEWRLKNTSRHYVGQVRFQEFVTILGGVPTSAKTAPTSIFSLLYIDPLARLDPTVGAIEEMRELGERAMYYTQRMPTLLNWQAEVMAYQLAGQPEARQLLKDADKFAQSAAVLAETTGKLPQLVNDQREAAIQQILDGLTNWGNQSGELLAGTRSTLESVGNAATNINSAIQSLAEFVRYVSPTNAADESAVTNRQPFNVAEYGSAASQIGIAANNLNALLASMNQSVPKMEDLSRQTAAAADRFVKGIFWWSVALVMIFLTGCMAAGLTYRMIANRLIRHAPHLSKPE